ncbi:MAG: 6-carboxytetrahydropterin synthase [Acidobacteria bacterium]|nr:6-carboxytetrahydropterin synthase [Acidobacteriota bacterium]
MVITTKWKFVFPLREGAQQDRPADRFQGSQSRRKKVVDYLDHKDINELPPFDKEFKPSAEEMAGYFLREVASDINDLIASRFIKSVSGRRLHLRHLFGR